MSDTQPTIEQIGELIDTEGFAAAILVMFGQDIARIEGYASLFAISRDVDPDTDSVFYEFTDGTCIIVTGGVRAEIG